MGLLNRQNVVLLFGAPGAGKGTQARFLAEALDVPHVASGDLLREHRRQGTELGRAAQKYMDAGDLVPDELVINMVLDRLDQPDATAGVLLDGFPRTVKQAQALDERLGSHGIQVAHALSLDVPTEVLVERLSGRWLCGECHTSYHTVFSPSPAGPDRCGNCGGTLYQREDDKREVVQTRLRKFLDETRPVVEYYQRRGILANVDGNQDIESVRADLAKAAGAGEKQSAAA